MRMKFWNVFRRVNNGDWVYIDRFYWRLRADECLGSHKLIDELYSPDCKIDYKINYE